MPSALMSATELKKYIGELEKKNKNLNEKYDGLWKIYTEDVKERVEENKNLNIKVASLEGEIKGLNYTIEKLREENQTLESDGYKM